MKRRRVILIGVGCLAAVVVAFVVWPGEREPEYQGKKLSEWLEVYCRHAGETETRLAIDRRQSEAADAVVHIGTNAVPLLLKWVRYETAGWRRSVRHVVYSLPSLISDSSFAENVTGDKRGERAYEATMGFRILGPLGSSAVPELTKLVNDSEYPETNPRALTALCELGQGGMDVVMAQLKSPSVSIRREAISAISRCDAVTNATSAVPVLIRSLEGANEGEAILAAECLGHLKLESHVVVPALIGCLKGSNAPVLIGPDYEINRQHMAVMALGSFGRRAVAAVPRLREIAGDSHGYMYRLATNSLSEIAREVLRTNAISE